jgi:hypothetical protein
MSNKEKSPKPKYQTPIIVHLGELAFGRGYCEAGSNPSEGYCSAGSVASYGYCTAGGSAISYCKAGTIITF